MQITITATVEVEVERVSGPFGSRDELEELVLEAVQEALDSGDPGNLVTGNDGEYETTAWEAEVQIQEQPKRTPRAKVSTDG